MAPQAFVAVQMAVYDNLDSYAASDTCLAKCVYKSILRRESRAMHGKDERWRWAQGVSEKINSGRYSVCMIRSCKVQTSDDLRSIDRDGR